jgi:hypothetical protein
MSRSAELERALRGAELAAFLQHTRGTSGDPSGHALSRLAASA